MLRSATLTLALALTIPSLARAQDAERPRPARGPNREPLHMERESALGVSPAYTFVGLGLTAGIGALMVWSLVDTLDASDKYKVDPTRERWEDGRRRVRRTWILGATASVTAIATLLVAILATDWGDDEDEPRLTLLPMLGPRSGGLALSGAFGGGGGPLGPRSGRPAG